MALQVAYIGNFEPEHSTENEVRKALLHNDHEVSTFQEGDLRSWQTLTKYASGFDFILWTRTKGLTPPDDVARDMARAAGAAGTPLVGYHLDRWWGLRREADIHNDAYFEICDVMCTADGGHDEHWKLAAGVDHRWFPPAISIDEAKRGTPRDEYRARVAFVGNWTSGYHPEWLHRRELVRHLRTRWRADIALWPKLGEPAVRGAALQDLYASVDVVVGDSCLVPTTDGHPMTRYCSDRIPETIGRGGFLLHPHVPGVTNDPDMFVDGQHLRCWEVGDWAALDGLIDYYLASPEDARVIAECGQAHVREHHTYDARVRRLTGMLAEGGYL